MVNPSLLQFHKKALMHSVFLLLILVVLAAFLSACGIPQLPLIAITGPKDQEIVEQKLSVSPTVQSSPTQTSIEVLPTTTANPTEVVPTPEPTQIPMPIMGVEVGWQNPQILSLLSQAGNHWIRANSLNWATVEPVEGERKWENVAGLSQDIQSYSSQGINPILIVHYTPTWAQKVPNSSCGPIREDKLQAFASFMKDAVTYYSAPPYKVKYWELGNEPDVDPKLVPLDSVFGCWGDGSDPYYGGEYYAEMLKVVYPVIKAADPQAKVLIGGLLLDCDPTNPPEGKDCLSSKFFEGILKAGGSDYFDIISFHGYPQYSSNTNIDADKDFPNWKARGGVVMGKVSFLREVMSAYQVDKPLLLSESSLICSERNQADCNPPSSEFFEAQADYAVKVYLRNWANNVGTIWYIFNGPGWRYGSMLDENQSPRPAYLAYQFLLSELNGAVYNKDIEQYAGLTGYQFTRGDTLIWVLWPETGNQVSFSLPEGTLKVMDKYGESLPDSQGQIQVSGPIYIELNR